MALSHDELSTTHEELRTAREESLLSSARLDDVRGQLDEARQQAARALSSRQQPQQPATAASAAAASAAIAAILRTQQLRCQPQHVSPPVYQAPGLDDIARMLSEISLMSSSAAAAAGDAGRAASAPASSGAKICIGRATRSAARLDA